MSTDLHIENYRVLSMTNVLSKFLAMGVPLQDLHPALYRQPGQGNAAARARDLVGRQRC